ncbi:hypothetical protein E2C01_015264 [Portunus trituberculatus]|uniref:Uncharacterized protein n=1 Tax=Portunus trituberculatus TaxID=210409 RepID=A0A5B7DMI0_PORTR|nr:hypothetical protein [Portunus trituberculatus]
MLIALRVHKANQAKGEPRDARVENYINCCLFPPLKDGHEGSSDRMDGALMAQDEEQPCSLVPLRVTREKEVTVEGFLTTDQIAAAAGCWGESDRTVSGYSGAFYHD